MKCLTLWMLMAIGSVAGAQTYRSVQISKLKFDAPEKEVAEAFQQQVDAFRLRLLGARIDGESYLTFDDPEVGELPQNLLHLVFKGEQKLPIQGAIDLALDYAADEVKTYRFTIPEGSTRLIKPEDFIKARKAAAEARASTGLAGRSWWWHQSGHAGEEVEGLLDPGLMMQTFDTFSGGRAIADNLALNRDLILGGAGQDDTVRIDTIQGVTVKAIDWSEHLPKEPVVVDSLALAIPEDQHALFAPTLPGLLSLMKRLELDATPLAGMVSSESSYRGLPQRYRHQLGLDMTDVAARLLPVKSVAITGGDPYFATGTDVAVLLETDKPEALFKALELGIKARAGSKAGITATEGSIKGVSRLRSYVNPEKGISSHICRIDNLVFVTNSQAQVRRLAEVAGKRAPALGETDEFRVFRHRYPKAGEDAFVFLSDATIRRWAGPVTRIGASRRNRALAALNELTCRNISACNMEDEFAPLLGRVAMINGRAISEHYGSAAFLTPISELGLAEVTQSEKQAYELWRGGYEGGWGQFFDPIAIQLKLTDESVDVDLTVLPLSINSDLQGMLGVCGEAKLSPRARLRPQGSILHFACAIDSKSQFFKEFDQQLVSVLPDLKINPLSWVGESVSVDFMDSLYWEGLGQLGFVDQLSQMPVVARVEVKNKLKLGLFLAAMRTFMQTSAPDTFNWINRKHGERTYVVIEQEEGNEFEDRFKICYAVVNRALLVTLNERLLKKAMDLEQMEIEEAQLAEAPQAKSVLLDADPKLVNVIDRLDGSYASHPRQARISWQAIPMLNEWRRRFPDLDPAGVHQKFFGMSLACPGGKGYRWNAQHWTMESVVYGHRGAPREPQHPQGLASYGRMLSGMDFVDDGLRLRLHLGQSVKLLSIPQPEIGPLIGKGAELGCFKPGRRLYYTGEDVFGQNAWEYEVVETKETPEGLLVITEEIWRDMDGDSKWMARYRIGQDGIWQLGGNDEFSSTTFTKPALDLPVELRLNAVHQHEADGRSVYEEEGMDADVSRYRERCELRVVGVETIKVKAGVFKDCVAIERHVESLGDDFYDATLSKEWYHPGTGMIQVEDEDGYRTTLVKIENTD